MPSIEELDARYYQNYVDEHSRFEQAVRHYLRPEHAVLDAGAGQGARYPYDYRARVRMVPRPGSDAGPRRRHPRRLTDR